MKLKRYLIAIGMRRTMRHSSEDEAHRPRPVGTMLIDRPGRRKTAGLSHGTDRPG